MPTTPPSEPTHPVEAGAFGDAPSVFVITGANRGLGLEFVRQISRDPVGHTVVACVRKPGTPELDLPRVHQVACDVSDEASVRAAGEHIAQLVDRVDVMINNAGVIGPGIESFEDITAQGMLDTYSVNVVGSVLVTQTLLPLLRRARGVPRCVFLSSGLSSNVATRRMSKTLTSYACSKAALNMLVTQMAVSERDVCAIAFGPGWCDTDLGRSVGAPPHKAEVTVPAGLRLFKTLSLEQSGRFLSFDGKEVPY